MSSRATLAEAAQSQTRVDAAPGGRTRVLFVTNAEVFGGTERHLIELLRHLDRSRLQATVLQTGEAVYAGLLGDDESVRLRTAAPGVSPRRWRRVIRESRPDTVVFVNCWIRSFPWHASLMARLAGARRVLSIQHLMAPMLDRPQGWSPGGVLRRLFGGRVRRVLGFRFSNKFIDATICVSNAVRDRLISEYAFPPRRTLTIHNGVRAQAASPAARLHVRSRLGVRGEGFLLVCVARLCEVKGVDVLLQALALARKTCPQVHCAIVGDGPLRDSLREQAAELGLGDCTYFEGFQQDVQPYLHAADAFVLTSHNEGFPLSILEAMACGLPCIVTAVGGNEEAVTQGVHGLVARAGDVQGIAQAIDRMIHDPEQRIAMASAAKARVAGEFAVDARMAEIAGMLGKP